METLSFLMLSVFLVRSIFSFLCFLLLTRNYRKSTKKTTQTEGGEVCVESPGRVFDFLLSSKIVGFFSSAGKLYGAQQPFQTNW